MSLTDADPWIVDIVIDFSQQVLLVVHCQVQRGCTDRMDLERVSVACPSLQPQVSGRAIRPALPRDAGAKSTDCLAPIIPHHIDQHYSQDRPEFFLRARAGMQVVSATSLSRPS